MALLNHWSNFILFQPAQRLGLVSGQVGGTRLSVETGKLKATKNAKKHGALPTFMTPAQVDGSPLQVQDPASGAVLGGAAHHGVLLRRMRS
jgi:hypothetical protein